RERDLDGQRSYLLGELQRQGRLAESEDAAVAPLRQDLAENETQRKALAAQIRSRFQRYAELSDPRPLEAATIQQKLLDADAALIEYLVGSDETYLFVLTRERLATFRLPVGSALLARQVASLRELLDTPQNQLAQTYLDQAYGLYRELLEQAAPLLKRKGTLLIASDGALLELPFEALLTGHRRLAGNLSFKDLPYLFLEHPIAYEPSASVLGELRRENAASVGAGGAGLDFLAFADPLVGAKDELVASEPKERRDLLPLR